MRFWGISCINSCANRFKIHTHLVLGNPGIEAFMGSHYFTLVGSVSYFLVSYLHLICFYYDDMDTCVWNKVKLNCAAYFFSDILGFTLKMTIMHKYFHRLTDWISHTVPGVPLPRSRVAVCALELTTPFHFPVSVSVHPPAVELVIFGPCFSPKAILQG